MLRGIYTAASGMMVQSERQNVISNNLANVDTDGFKKDQTVIKEFPEFDIYRKDDVKEITPFEVTSKLTRIGRLGTGAALDNVYTEFTPGKYEPTNNSLDFAIGGEEFFAVDTKTGIKFTRDGSFTLDNEGYVITQNGDKVLGAGKDGKFGYIKPQESKFVIKGVDLVNSDIIGDIKIPGLTAKPTANNTIITVNVDDKKSLVKEGRNYYNTENVKNMTISLGATLKQGFLEKSNVSAVKEMVEMIECSRAYETNQKILTSQDEVLSKVVNEVGKWT